MRKKTSNFVKGLFFALLFFICYSFYKFQLLKGVADGGKLTLTSRPQQKSESSIKTNLIKVVSGDKILLSSNVEAQESTNKLQSTGNCSALVSGGFYTKEDKHIGLFISEKTKISGETDNPFYNGFLSISSSGKVSISTTPQENARFALQSGPLVVLNGKAQNLETTKDESARRVVVAQSNNAGEVIFIIFYNSENNLFGPKLSEVPGLLDLVEKDQNIEIINALNLDGGSHSAFLTEEFKIPEIQRVGSYFCIQS